MPAGIAEAWACPASYSVRVSDELVPLCVCADLNQAQAIRASLEARGVPTLIDGEHQRNILGMFGTVVVLRIMIPRSQLRLGYELALEIIPDLPPLELDDEDDDAYVGEPMPLRRPLPEDLQPPDDPEDEHEQDDEDDEDEALAELAEDDMAELRERRRLLGPRVGFGLGMIYALATMAYGNFKVGFVLAVVMVALAYFRVMPITAEPS